MDQWLGHSICDEKAMSSASGRGATIEQLWASCSHPCASVTEQYNLVLGTGQRTVTLRGFESYDRSGVLLTVCYTVCGLSWLSTGSQRKGDEHLVYALGMAQIGLFLV